MGEVFGDVHRATARVFGRSGISVSAPALQGCCGALHAHDGDIDFARKLARKNIDDFERSGDTPIIVNSAGCAAAMKEYWQLLEHDERYAERAKQFSGRVFDPSEYLATKATLPHASLDARITYQDACHLAHAQRIRNEPRALLASIHGCDVRETIGGDVCCGAAGIYSLVQPEMSAALRTRKADQFRETNPEIVVTANPGCQMQYASAVREAGIDAEVLHIMELLDRAQAD
jgi:glycolate oxidase iron-sulfur subunit